MRMNSTLGAGRLPLWRLKNEEPEEGDVQADFGFTGGVSDRIEEPVTRSYEIRNVGRFFAFLGVRARLHPSGLLLLVSERDWTSEVQGLNS